MLIDAWNTFRRGKRKRRDIAAFEYRLEENVFQLSRELTEGIYLPDDYSRMVICDPKIRVIHKASVRDRLVHHVVSEYLEELFEPYLPSCIYSARKDKGTHVAVDHLVRGVRSVSRNYRLQAWALKCDIKRFCASIDHNILLGLLRGRGVATGILTILERIIRGFRSEVGQGKGLPIGNLTSQILGNVYLLPLDTFINYQRQIHEYFRYTDDFVVLSPEARALQEIREGIRSFLEVKLGLQLHERKVIIRPLSQGIDFLGYVVLPFHRQIRTKTRQRMLKRLNARLRDKKEDRMTEGELAQSVSSYLGMLKHADAYELSLLIQNCFS